MANILLECLPPKCDYLSYLTIIESQLSSEILPSLNDILQDPVLTQNIGWDLIHHLLPIPGSETCLISIARLGNPREVILKVTESLQLLKLNLDDEKSSSDQSNTGPTNIDKFCTLVNLLSILHPRIKTKFPSRFLLTSLKSILSNYRPSNPATLAIISFLHTISGAKRPPIPNRNSTLEVSDNIKEASNVSAPDPEAQDEDPEEEAAQVKLLQSFITHLLEEYLKVNPIEWAARIQESIYPEKVVEGKCMGRAFREDPNLQARDSIVGQLVALSRDLGLTQYETLFRYIYKEETLSSEKYLDENDVFPYEEDIPISKVGSLMLVSSLIFSSLLFKSQLPVPNLSIFPDHAKLIKHFIGVQGPHLIGEEYLNIIDAILGIGLWIESKNQFVAGPLDDEEFLDYLQLLSLLSLNTPSSTLRYAAHILCSSVLHAHPVDQLRLSFISDTLENCPFEILKASAVTWFKEEILTSSERKSDDIFSSPAALAATQPFLFPTILDLLEATDEELTEEIRNSSPFYMAVLNFLFLLKKKQFSHIIPTGMLSMVEKIYLRPFKTCLERAQDIISRSSSNDSENLKVELQLLEERVNLCLHEINSSES